MPILPSGGARYIEPGGASASSVATAYLVQDVSGNWTYSSTGPATGELVSTNAGGTYEILTFVTAVIVFDGTDYVVQATGTPAALIAFDGTDYFITTDLTQTKAATIRISATGDYVIVPLTPAVLTARQIAGVNILVH